MLCHDVQVNLSAMRAHSHDVESCCALHARLCIEGDFYRLHGEDRYLYIATTVQAL